jgi:hypothetical protein
MWSILGMHLSDQLLQQQQQQQQQQQAAMAQQAPFMSADQIMSAMLGAPVTVGPNGTITYRGRTIGPPLGGVRPIPGSPEQVSFPPPMQFNGVNPQQGARRGPAPPNQPVSAPTSAQTPPWPGVSQTWRPAPWPGQTPSVSSTVGWVPGDPNSSTTLDPGNLYPPDVPIDPNVPVTNGPGGYPAGGGGGGEEWADASDD